jgi:hypothetical protein
MDHPPEHRDAFAGARMVRIGDDYFERLFVRSMSLAYRGCGKRKLEVAVQQARRYPSADLMMRPSVAIAARRS